ncbi:MAG: helix-turn-helix domain-containing protein [Jiangellaceae bacterium]
MSASTEDLSRRRRAAPLPHDERRAAIIAAAIPLLRRHGRSVSTREIAEAAGVAEGTIFRAFGDKDTLIRHTVVAALDPSAAERQLAQIDLLLPLSQRITAAADILQQRMTSAFELLTRLGMIRPPEDEENVQPGSCSSPRAGLMDILALVFEPDRDRLRCSPHEAARLLRVLTFAGSHPVITDGTLLTSEQICSLLLDGIRDRSGVDPC